MDARSEAEFNVAVDSRPPLRRDIAYSAVTVTQFLGAFNDNLFKQLLLLLCVELKRQDGLDYQSRAMAVFAIPFVLFSGYAGFLGDRNGKRGIFVACKVAEIVVMALAMLAFYIAGTNLQVLLTMQLCVLFLMSAQSAFFGPAKYGILPELFRKDDLPAVNGMVLMTTFVAIIFGTALAGFSRDLFGQRVWIVSLMCVALAIVGTLASLFVRKTPAASPDLPFVKSALWIPTDVRALLRRDVGLLLVLLVTSTFWFIGAVVQTVVNEYGLVELGLNNTRTSLIAASLGVGIALGCVVAGRLQRRIPGSKLVTIGGLGIVVSLVGAGLSAPGVVDDPDTTAAVLGSLPGPESWWQMLIPQSVGELLARGCFTLLGLSAGCFVVPLQVVLQSRPPEALKGRAIATMNLMNWVGILLGAAVQGVVTPMLDRFDLPISTWFYLLGLVMLPIPLLFRLPGESETSAAG